MNKSFTYLLPLYCKYLKDENLELEEKLFVSFVDECYCYSNVNDQLEKKFIIQLNRKNEDQELLRKYLQNIKKSSIFDRLKNSGNHYFIYFNIPDEILKDYQNFIKGKFSKFKASNKIYILKFFKDNVSLEFSTKVNQIFSKSKQKKEELEKELEVVLPEDSELSSIPDTLSETLKL